MAIEYPIPRANAAPLDERTKAFRTEWYNFLRTLASQATNSNLQAEIEALAVRVLALEDAESLAAVIVGLGSVLVSGTLADGQVFVQLEGDVDLPGGTYFYGTNADGDKGWFLRDLGTLADVDLATTPPSDGDALTWDATAERWVPLAIPTPTGSGGEILVQDGSSAPPVMLTNEAEDDFLYSD